VQEVYVEAGTLSETLDNVGSQKAKIIETIGTDPSTPSGYVLASKQESDFEGFQTNRFTFLKPSVLSRNVETRNNGKLRVETVEAFNETPTSTIGGVQISIRESDVEGIPTNQYVFANGNGEVSRTVDTRNQGKLTITTVESLGSAGTAIGLQIEATIKEEDGYKLFRNTFADGRGEVSRTTETRNNGALTITTIEALGSAGSGAGVEIEATTREQDGYTLFRNTFAEGDGQIFISESAGPNNIPGTTRRTIRAFGVAIVPSGVLIESQDIVRDGYTEYIRTTLYGGIEGVKTRYADVATVEVPGTVSCTTQDVTEGDVEGTIAIVTSTPRRQKQVATLVTIKITTEPDTSASRAYDLGAISCSVTSVQTKLQSGDGSVATAVDGSTTISSVGFQKSFASSASTQNYVGSYLISDYSEGSVSYQSSEQPYLSSPNSISVQTAFSSSSSSCTGTGATSPIGYVESGVISRTVEPVLTALNGITYYQVVTEEAI
jgi:hypothetical protein